MNNSNIVYLSESEISIFFNKIEQNIKIEKNTNEKKRLIRNKALFAVMYYCGLRVTETVNLKTAAYNQKEHDIYCTRIKGGKSNTLKFMPDFAWVESALKKHIKANHPKEYLFTNLINTKNPLSRKTCDIILRNLFFEVGFSPEKCHCNIFRNSIAMHLIDRGIEILELQYWLGHISIANTAVYYKNPVNISTKNLYRKLSVEPTEEGLNAINKTVENKEIN